MTQFPTLMKNMALSRIRSNGAYLLIACSLLLGPRPARAEAPPAPTNFQARITPSEVLLTWDPSPGADYYRIHRATSDRRWVLLPQHLTIPRLRDADFPVLPGYYWVIAYNAAGENAGTEFRVENVTSDVDYYAHVVRQLSESSVSIGWLTVGSPADAVLEVGQGTNESTLFMVDPNLGQQHEFIVSNLTANSTYWFRLTSTASNHAGFTYRNSFTSQPYVEPAEGSISIAPPMDSTLTTDEDKLLPIFLSADNPNGLPLEFTVTAPYGPTRGRMSGTPPHLIYTPGIASGFDSSDFFTCSVSDGQTTSSANLIITVNAKNHAPYARDASVVIPEDTLAQIPFRGMDLEASPFTTLQFILLTPPTNATLRAKSQWEPSILIYMPNTNFHGVDHLTYAATYGITTGNVATVRFAVTPVNDAPEVVNQSVSVLLGGSVKIPLAVTDPDGDFLNFSILSNPRSGTVSYTWYQEMTYVSRPNATNTSDTFSYEVTDGALVRTGTVSIVILPVAPPVAPSDLVASATAPGMIDLTWSDNSWNEDSFQLERAVDNEPWTLIATIGPNARAFADTTFTKKKTYSYRVRALNSVGPSAYSNPVSIKSLK